MMVQSSDEEEEEGGEAEGSDVLGQAGLLQAWAWGDVEPRPSRWAWAWDIINQNKYINNPISQVS